MDDNLYHIFSREVIPRIQNEVSIYDYFLWKNAGDGFLICSDSCFDAALIALKMRDFVRHYPWLRFGFSEKLEVRIAAHFCSNAMVKVENGQICDVIGQELNLASRIEPITEPNRVYCSEIFYKIIEHRNCFGEHLDVVGRDLGIRELAKEKHKLRLYELDWKQDSMTQLEPQHEEPQSSPSISPKTTQASYSDEVDSGGTTSPISWNPNGLWASDASQIQIDRTEHIIFKNQIINEFIESNDKYFICANKGLGKTLLLTYKRFLLTNTYKTDTNRKTTSICFIPEDKPFLDLMGDIPSVSKSHLNFLSNLHNSKRMWGFALKISALSFHSHLAKSIRGKQFQDLPSNLERWLYGESVEPTIVFKELLGHSVKEINKIIDRTENTIENLFRSIQSGVFFFIDKVDQGIRSLNKEAWIYVQAGLIEAAWDVTNTNRHVKVFSTIRQEAFYNYESDTKTNLYGATLTIKYSESDLEKLLDKLTYFYEGKSSFKEFINMRNIASSGKDCVEDSFKYLYRHTLGRPRDLVIISSELSRNRNNMDEYSCRQIIKDISSDILTPNIFNEMNVFLECLKDKSIRFKFLSSLDYNILTRNELISKYCEFNNIEDCFSTHGLDSKDLYHPFCELYNTGLLGIVFFDDIRGCFVQKFKQPSDKVDDYQSNLPSAEYYLVHPSLYRTIKRQHSASSFFYFKYIIVGHNYFWYEHFDLFIKIQKEQFKLHDSENKDRIDHLLREYSRQFSRGANIQDIRLKISNSNDCITTLNVLEKNNYDDLFLYIYDLLGINH